MRYKIMKLIDKLLHRSTERCVDCGRELTALEAYYYDCRCEKCEKKVNDKLYY